MRNFLSALKDKTIQSAKESAREFFWPDSLWRRALSIVLVLSVVWAAVLVFAVLMIVLAKLAM